MSTLYLTQERSIVKQDGDTLVVLIPADSKTGTDKRTVRVPLIKVDQVVVEGDATITSPAMRALLANGVEISFCSYHGRFAGRLSPEFSKNGLLRIEQHRAHNDRARSLDLAKRFVEGKVGNMRTLLMRYNRKLEDEELTQAIASLKRVLDQAKVVQDDGREPPDPRDPQKGTPLGTLLGLEGSATAFYFGAFGSLLKQDLGFRGRSKRPPKDPVNALLSYGYTLLAHKVSSAINVVGMDPYVGYLHSTQYGKPALALDLMEEFRPVIVDSVVLTVINNGILQADDFAEELGAYRLTERGRRAFLTRFEERLNTEIRHPVFEYKATYKRCLELQVRLLAKTLTREIPEYPPFVVR